MSESGKGQPPRTTLCGFTLLPQAKEPQPHLQRVHHTVGQHGHLPGHRLDTLLKLGNVRRGEHVAQRYATCKGKGKKGLEPCGQHFPAHRPFQSCSRARPSVHLTRAALPAP